LADKLVRKATGYEQKRRSLTIRHRVRRLREPSFQAPCDRISDRQIPLTRHEKKIVRAQHPTGYIQINPWLELNEESREGLMLQILEDAGVLTLATLGASAIDCFQAAVPTEERFSVYASASPIAATLDIVKRTGLPVTQVLEDLSTWLDQDKIRLASIPSKVATPAGTRR